MFAVARINEKKTQFNRSRRPAHESQDEEKSVCGCIPMFAVGLAVAAHLRRRISAYSPSFRNGINVCVCAVILLLLCLRNQIFSAKQAYPSVRLDHFRSTS